MVTGRRAGIPEASRGEWAGRWNAARSWWALGQHCSSFTAALQTISNQRSLFLSMLLKGPQQFYSPIVCPSIPHCINFILFQVKLFYCTHFRLPATPFPKQVDGMYWLIQQSAHIISPICPGYPPKLQDKCFSKTLVFSLETAITEIQQ